MGRARRGAAGCLAEHGPLAAAELGRRLGISENAAASALSMLAQAGKVRIMLAATDDRGWPKTGGAT